MQIPPMVNEPSPRAVVELIYQRLDAFEENQNLKLESLRTTSNLKFDALERGHARIEGWLGDVDVKVDEAREQVAKLVGSAASDALHAARSPAQVYQMSDNRPATPSQDNLRRIGIWFGIAAASVGVMGGLSAAFQIAEKILSGIAMSLR